MSTSGTARLDERWVTKLENLLPEHAIKDGAIIWYSGRTSLWGWDCPAEIIAVKDRTFRVISLDDCKEQKQVYDFDVGEHTPDSRKSMHVPTDEKLMAWLREDDAHFHTTGVREDKDTESFFVDMDVKKFSHVVQWLVERWARMNQIDKNSFSALGFTNAICFKKADDAVLFNIAFSRGIDWSRLR